MLFPITVVIEEECDFRGEGGESCDGGYIVTSDGTTRCPACEKRSTIGPGSDVTRPPSNPDDGDYREAVQIVNVDAEGLKYVKGDLKDIAADITARIAGIAYKENVNVAKNPDQVSSLYENRTTVLIKIGESLAKVHKWANETVAKLRYSSFITSSNSYGTEFYQKTLKELYEMYGKAKEDGLPDAALDAIMLKIYNNEFVNNKDRFEREKLLLAVEPFPHKKQEELEKLIEKGLISEEDFVIQINFNNFVKRFERENGSITKFGSLLVDEKKHELILEELKKYSNEKKTNSSREKVLLRQNKPETTSGSD